MRTRTVLATTFAALILSTTAAQATPPGPGVTAKLLAQKTVGDKDYVLRELTIPPGQTTGWHYHDGMVYGFIEEGTLSHFDATCDSDGVYQKGQVIEEGPNYVHIGRNLSDKPLVLKALYILPHGAPFSEDAPNPGCDFQ
ncbi:cupin domain-containing protein [Streptomyces acidiscabies]|uniref:Cupin n=1 Tax=Streptomyces acidiscabies TaxID=42234 RepID=A0A0L0JSZ8_9ACTN|nr:cupin domain-containing protein [Streptomyces acidiscabies]KND28917.1 cupin [Streptomyces acidiscabies]